ncbi:MAG: hypothetical protein A2033_04005 [Bacteroidetes bacterium GWA2_31_9]|nr:MAG: hypothetical protein A2033_04005 [Bacteroidetes bacterium GWA2_31_9]
MTISRGDIVEVNFLLPNGDFKPHPVIVLSDTLIQEIDNCFICTMITSKEIDDEASFHLTDNMFSKPPKKKCQVRCQLLTFVPEKQMIRKISSLKKTYVDKIALKVFQTCLSDISDNE